MFYIDFQALHFHTGFQQLARLEGILLIFVGGPEIDETYCSLRINFKCFANTPKQHCIGACLSSYLNLKLDEESAC